MTPCPYTVGPHRCVAGPAGHPGRHDWPAWRRVSGEHELQADDGRVLARVYRTGSRLMTDKWGWSAGTDHGRAGALLNAMADAERSAYRQL